MRDDRKITRDAALETIDVTPCRISYRILSQGKSSKFTDVGGETAKRRTAEVQNVCP